MEKQNSKDVSFKKYNKGGLVSTIFGLIEAVLWIAVGVVAIIFSDNKDFHNAIFLVIGIMLTISGLMKIITNFMPIVANSFVEAAIKAKAKAEMSYNLVVGGSFELALGVTFIIIYATNAALFQSIISIIASYVGIIMIVAGLSLILFAIGFIISKLYTVGVTI
ncbi:MAG: hypothetical protein K5694_05340, partial [Bacilli bacterium]|nr:hypothetical protein [Bacilli bacterium]